MIIKNMKSVDLTIYDLSIPNHRLEAGVTLDLTPYVLTSECIRSEELGELAVDDKIRIVQENGKVLSKKETIERFKMGCLTKADMKSNIKSDMDKTNE